MAGLSPINIHNVPVATAPAFSMPVPDDITAAMFATQQGRVATAMANTAADLEVHHLLPKVYKPIFNLIGVDCDNWCIVLLAAQHKLFNNIVLAGTVNVTLALESYQGLWDQYVLALQASTAFQQVQTLAGIGAPTPAQAAQLAQLRTALAAQVTNVVYPMMLRRVGLDPNLIAPRLVPYSIVSQPVQKLQAWYHPTAWKPLVWNNPW